MLRRILSVVILVLFIFAVTGCASVQTTVKRDWKEGTVGAVAGAVTGVIVTGDTATSNLAGGVIGAASGFALGVGVKELFFKNDHSDPACPAVENSGRK
jgi:uncharacterized protein YceK